MLATAKSGRGPRRGCVEQPRFAAMNFLFLAVESVFDCFDVVVAEDVPGEVADFFDGDVELAFFEGFGDFFS